MYFLEGTFIAISIALLVAIDTSCLTRRACQFLFMTGLAVAIATLFVGQARIHMVPVALVFLACALFLLKRSRSHIVLRSIGLALGLALSAVSVTLALALPVVSLPAPEGPYAVGVHAFNLVDESRNEAIFGEPDRLRELYVQAWYPAVVAGDDAARPVRGLWQELYRFPVFDILFGYLEGIETHSYEDAPLATREQPYPAIVFSPSFGGIAEQNSLLMEHLASNGYVVFGITHPHFGVISAYSDGSGVATDQGTLEATAQQGSIDLEALRVEAERVSDPVEQARVWLEYFDKGTMLSEFMEIWVRDIQVLLDAMVSPGDDGSRKSVLFSGIDSDRIGLLGMSYGGGAVTELCKRDDRCAAVMNLDGGLWGRRMREPLTVPCLVLASAGNSMFFNYGLLTSEAPYYLGVVDGATHVNFTDASAFVPLFDWVGITGPIEGRRAIEIMNVASARFFDIYLRHQQSQSLEFSEFPELSLRTNGIVLSTE